MNLRIIAVFDHCEADKPYVMLMELLSTILLQALPLSASGVFRNASTVKMIQRATPVVSSFSLRWTQSVLRLCNAMSSRRPYRATLSSISPRCLHINQRSSKAKSCCFAITRPFSVIPTISSPARFHSTDSGSTILSQDSKPGCHTSSSYASISEQTETCNLNPTVPSCKDKSVSRIQAPVLCG